MLHFFSHSYKGIDHHFIWDVESGSLHDVDYVAFLCAKKKYDSLLPREEEAYAAVDEKTIAEVAEELDTLEKEGSINYPCQIVSFKKNANVVKSMCFNICHDCNMRCVYCFAGGGSYNTPRNYMSLEVGKKSVDFLINNSGNRQNLEIDFFGGEPLLNLDVVKQIVIYAKEEGEKHGKSFSFTITTNCVALDEETGKYLNETMDNVVLSIDGRKDVHTKTRKALSKDDTYEKIVENAVNFRKIRGDKKYYVRGTFTADNLDFCEDIKTLNDLGFDEISIEPVVLPQTSSLSIKKEHLSKILDEYERFTDFYLERRETHDKWFNFFHFMVDLEHGPCVNKRMTGCGAGTEYLSVSPTGELYPCHQFVGQPEYVLGNVFDGIKRQDIREKMASVSVASRPQCMNCYAKYYCGGGCYANNLKYGSDNGLYELGCEMMRKRFELSLAVAGIEAEKENL